MNTVPGDEEQPLVEHIKELRGQRKKIYGALLGVALLVSAGPDMLSGLVVAALLVILFEASFPY